MAGYTRDQLDTIRRIKRTPEFQAASPRERKAAFETVLAESNARDVPHGDRDSEGAFQQRPSQGWGPASETLEQDAAQFLAAARKANTQGGSAGQLAQRVQRSAFPGSYDQRSKEADALVKGSGPTVNKRSSSASAGTPPTLTPGSTATDTKGAVTAALLDNRKGMSLVSRIQEQVSSGKYTTTTAPKVTPGKYGVAPASPPSKSGQSPKPRASAAKGTADFEGTKVAAWIAPALEYARKHGWTGKVNSGFRTLADQTRIYNSGVRPAAKPGTSNHEGTDFPRGAVDVSEAQQLASILHGSPYAKKLVYAGAKDPVHFSHPHGGSY